MIELVLSSDEKDVLIWNTNSGELLNKLGGHNKPIRWICSSPTDESFMSTSDDQRARYWIPSKK